MTISTYQPGTTEAPSDEALLNDHLAGDPNGFGRLVARYQRELFHFLVRFLSDRTLADDVFQDTFLQVYQSAELFDHSRRFRPWLFTIAVNKWRDALRSQSRRASTPLQASISAGDSESGEFIDLLQSNIPGPSEPMEHAEVQKKVQEIVAAMPDHLREILLLAYFHQFPYKQISELLDIPLGTVKSRLHAAVAHFAEKWKSANKGHADS